MTAVLRFLRADEGSTAIEYALLAGIMCLALVAGAQLIGGNLAAWFVRVGNGFGA